MKVKKMVLNEDEDMRRIYAGKYPNPVIYPCALTRNSEQIVMINLLTATLANDKQGHSSQNVEVEAEIHRLDTESGIVTQGKHTLVFPKKAFYRMMKAKGIPLVGNARSYHIIFKKKNVKDYEILKITEVPVNNFIPEERVF